MTVMKKDPKSAQPMQWAILLLLAVTVIAFIYQAA